VTTVLTIDGQLGGGTGRFADLNLNGFSQELAGLSNVARASRVQRIVNSNVSNAATLTLNTAADSDFSGNLGGSVGGSVSASAMPGSTGGNNFNLTKRGTGTLTLSGNNTFAGDTTIMAGTLKVNGSLGGTTEVTVNATGRLLLDSASNNFVNTAAVVNLAGGTLAFGNAANQSQALGTLGVTANSTLDFGSAGGNDTFLFAGPGSHTAGARLTVANWVGSLSGGTDGIHDRLVFSGSSSAFTAAYTQSDVSFTGFGTGYRAIDFGGTTYEIVPVPEPAWIGAAVVVLLASRLRRTQI
jgi:fibronectin-binding autotransporter adhesin